MFDTHTDSLQNVDDWKLFVLHKEKAFFFYILHIWQFTAPVPDPHTILQTYMVMYTAFFFFFFPETILLTTQSQNIDRRENNKQTK